MTVLRSGGQRFSDSVMGRDAILVTSGILAVAGVAQLVGISASRALDEVDGRGSIVDTAWSLLLILAFFLILSSKISDIRPGCDDMAMVFETVGSIMFVVGSATYAAAVLIATGFPGNLIVLGYCISTIINVLGRQWILHRRARQVFARAKGASPGSAEGVER